MARFELSVNGGKKVVDADPEMPLLWALRDLLGLRGTKFGCGIAQCRACTVHIDGVETFSCKVSVESAEGSEITTIEGLAPKRLQVLQDAWIAEEVPQCGYCQVGQIMAAAALLERTPRPTDDDIDAAMINICRCGTYNRIIAAIEMAAKSMKGGGR
jgi:isoquinoline 1-oxidoreductase alpha subunit